ncbi:hypothetical protein PENANT_c009G05575 [Penicillium antarcticum]|uniref:Methyltransferase type 11 domain-containing protein n=1 Tax=Penicillium antarcticum TaxID=416450 RepID=A0A1V6Q902_9EURO|nr:uncharacterized protein N7508_006303 [Penicillium antarcticum]KAJ5301440.1 hypothetical protein N7508_006303 [Penicillium antarcticum]OQD85710.1 hypothetical protein PENANT_c009G05575 [Penicillium antarcticum]
MPPEATFKSYTPTQGKTYAQARSTYHPNFYKALLAHHTRTGGQTKTLIDVGCGPGPATRDLAVYFDRAIGFDASPGMIETAKSLGGKSLSGEEIEFCVSGAEELGRGLKGLVVEDGSVDLITAATAAHWFDMPRFWERAGRLLKPGGTVAIWAMNVDGPADDMPNAEAIRAGMDLIRERELEAFFEEGNRLVRGLYVGLPLPWECGGSGEGFEKESFVRREWGTEGGIDTRVAGNEFLLHGERIMGLDGFEVAMGTASPVTRWREANPGLVGTEGDVIRLMRRMIERCLREAGVSEEEMVVKGKGEGVLLMVKKK